MHIATRSLSCVGFCASPQSTQARSCAQIPDAAHAARSPPPQQTGPGSDARSAATSVADTLPAVMSWQAYVDDNLIKSGMVTAAGIYDLQGNPWASSEGFALQVAEVAAVSGWLHSGQVMGMAASGALIAAEKYMFCRGDDDDKWVYVKKGKNGCVFIACTQCIVVCMHDDKTQQGACTAGAQKIADTLKGAGY